MKATVQIDSDDMAFDGEEKYNEIARILRVAADIIDSGSLWCPLYDINGNEVGTLSVDEQL